MANSGRYDDPTFLARMLVPLAAIAGGAATTTYGQLPMIMSNAQIRKVYSYVTVAGTGTLAGFAVFNGTGSQAVVTVGTATAATVSTSADLNVAAGASIAVVSLSDATVKASFAFEIQNLPSSTWS